MQLKVNTGDTISRVVWLMHRLEAALQLAAQQRQPAGSAASRLEGLLPPPGELSIVAEHCNDRKRSAKFIQVQHQ